LLVKQIKIAEQEVIGFIYKVRHWSGVAGFIFQCGDEVQLKLDTCCTDLSIARKYRRCSLEIFFGEVSTCDSKA